MTLPAGTIELHPPAGVDHGVLQQLSLMGMRFPGDHVLTVVSGKRRLTLGWRYEPSEACLAALRESSGT